MKQISPFLLLSCFLAVTKINAQIQTKVDTTLAGTYFHKGNSFLEERKLDSALVYFKKALPIYKRAETWERTLITYNKIAETYITGEQNDKAYDFTDQAIKINRTKLDNRSPEVASSYQLIGDFYSRKYDFEKALEFANKSLEIRQKLLGENDPKIALSYNNIARVYGRMGQIEKALTLFFKSLEIYQFNYGKTSHKLISVCSNIALVYTILEDYKKSSEYLKKALVCAKSKYKEDHPKLIDVYYKIGVNSYNSDNFKESLHYYKKALEVSKKTNDTIMMANVIDAMGDVYHSLRESDKALEYYSESLFFKQKVSSNDSPKLAITYNGMGNAYLDNKNYSKALEFYRKSLDIDIKTFGKNAREIIPVIHNIGLTYFKQKEYNKALEFYQNGERLIKINFGEHHTSLGHSYELSGKAYRELKDYIRAIEYEEKAVRLYTKNKNVHHPRLAKTYNDLGITYFEKGDFEKSIEYFDLAIIENRNKNKRTKKNKNSFDPNEFSKVFVLIKSLINKGKTLTSLYKIDNDISNLEKSIECYQMAEKALKIEGQQISNYSDQLAYGETLKFFCNNFFGTYILSSDIEKAFLYSEKSKAIILNGLLNSSSTESISSIPDRILNLERDLRIDKSNLISKVKKTQDSIKIAEYENKLFDISRSQDSLMSVIEKEYPNYYQLKYKDDIISISEIQEHLRDQETLVEFFIADSSTYVFTINKEKLAVKELATPDLKKQIDQLRKSVLDKDNQAYKQIGYELYQTLLAPIENELKGNSLIIVPDGPLWHLNFDLLLTEKSEGNNPKDFAYLLKKYAITYANSANLLYTDFQKNNQAQEIKKECLAFSFADSTATAENRSVSLATLRDTGDDLPGTRKEIKAIANIIDGQYFYGSQADEANFKENVGQYNILHLALHGEVDNENPQNSKLFFTKSKDTIEDNELYSHELFALNIPAELTVLSACNTGSGKIATGEGIMSLGTAFQYAGTKSLLLTNWEVSDQTTPELMQYFYTNLKKGMNKGLALKQAKLSFLEQAPAKQSYPFYWGGFYLLGNQAAIDFPNNNLWYWSIGIGIILLSLFIFLVRKKKLKR